MPHPTASPPPNLLALFAGWSLTKVVALFAALVTAGSAIGVLVAFATFLAIGVTGPADADAALAARIVRDSTIIEKHEDRLDQGELNARLLTQVLCLALQRLDPAGVPPQCRQATP